MQGRVDGSLDWLAFIDDFNDVVAFAWYDARLRDGGLPGRDADVYL
jgi:hypothetical protein